MTTPTPSPDAAPPRWLVPPCPSCRRVDTVMAVLTHDSAECQCEECEEFDPPLGFFGPAEVSAYGLVALSLDDVVVLRRLVRESLGILPTECDSDDGALRAILGRIEDGIEMTKAVYHE